MATTSAALSVAAAAAAAVAVGRRPSDTERHRATRSLVAHRVAQRFFLFSLIYFSLLKKGKKGGTVGVTGMLSFRHPVEDSPVLSES